MVCYTYSKHGLNQRINTPKLYCFLQPRRCEQTYIWRPCSKFCLDLIVSRAYNYCCSDTDNVSSRLCMHSIRSLIILCLAYECFLMLVVPIFCRATGKCSKYTELLEGVATGKRNEWVRIQNHACVHSYTIEHFVSISKNFICNKVYEH